MLCDQQINMKVTLNMPRTTVGLTTRYIPYTS